MNALQTVNLIFLTVGSTLSLLSLCVLIAVGLINYIHEPEENSILERHIRFSRTYFGAVFVTGFSLMLLGILII